MRRILRAVFLGFDALLVLLFLVGYAARYVHPRYGWWAELVAVGLPYLSAAVLAVLAGALAARRWRLAAGHALLALLVAVRFLPPGGLPRWEAPGPDALTLLTFNVPHWGGVEQEAAQATPGARAVSAAEAGHAPLTLEALTRRIDPDLIALQETWIRYERRPPHVQTSARHLISLIDSLHYDVARVEGRHRRTTLPVLSRLRLLDQEHHPLPGPAGRDTSFAVRTRFAWRGREAVFYNLHLRSFGPNKPWEEERLSPMSARFWRRYLRQYRRAYRVRAVEAEAVRAMLDEETLPVLVAGDFNSTPHSWVYRTLSRGMQDAYQAAGWGWGATYHARLPFVRIDFILASEEWEVLSAEVPDVDLSDHRPLVAHLRWRDE